VAEIEIQKKRSGWVWLVVLALLTLLVWLVADWMDGPDEAEAVQTAAPAAGMTGAVAPATMMVIDPSVPAPAVAAFVGHIRGGEARMGSDHVYTAQGIARMADALRELVQAHTAVGPRAAAGAERFYTLAAALVVSPDSLRMHADWVSEAASSAATVLEGLSDAVKGPVPELREQVAEVRTAARAIDPARDLLQQQDQVRAFFRQAADAMAMLVNPRP
jgi:hypothetical protein